VLDLDYAEDSGAQADANFVLTGSGHRRDPGDRRGRALQPKRSCWACWTWRAKRHGGAGREAEGRPSAHEQACKLTGKLVLASHNAGKVRENGGLLARIRHGPSSAPARSACRSRRRRATTFIGNATMKAMAAMTATGLVALADDSGFEVARWMGPRRLYRRLDDAAGRDAGLRLAMAKVEAGTPWRGPHRWFTCVLVLAWPDGHTEGFEGRVDPAIGSAPPRGENGFGYDPMFVPEGETFTFGEMPPEQKARHSHRARAFAALAAAIL
jgi:XTP/dITP diphosphohydrolase